MAALNGSRSARPPGASPWSSTRVEVALVVIFTLLMTLPFIFRPFHMDDAGFLEFARVRQERPLEVALADYTFFGNENPVFIDTHPPLLSSYQALLIRIAGSESETFLHLGFLVFPLVTAVSMYYLSRRFTRHRLLATLLLVGSPGVVVMSHGLMSDLPGLSMWLLSATLYLYGIDRRSQLLMGLCAVAITVGVMISYQVLSIIPLLFVYALVRRELSVLSVLPFALPVSTFVSYFLWHHSIVGVFPRLSYGVGSPLAWYSIIQKIVSVSLALGGAMVFTGALMRVMLRRKLDFAVYMTLLVPMWISMMTQYFAGNYTMPSVILSLLFMPVGLLLLYQIFGDVRERLRQPTRRQLANNVFLSLWLSGVLFYVILLLPYASVRYLLPLFPPAILLFVRLTESYMPDNEKLLANILIAAVLASSSIALLVAGADYELAQTYKRFAAVDGRRLGDEAESTGNQAWYVGEFGYRYYMEQQGFKQLPEDTLVAEGDLIVQAPLADPRPFSDELGDRIELVEIIGYQGEIPLRVTSFQAKAGFYGHFWGLLPYSLAAGNVEEFLVFRVVTEEERDQAMRDKAAQLLFR